MGTFSFRNGYTVLLTTHGVGRYWFLLSTHGTQQPELGHVITSAVSNLMIFLNASPIKYCIPLLLPAVACQHSQYCFLILLHAKIRLTSLHYFHLLSNLTGPPLLFAYQPLTLITFDFGRVLCFLASRIGRQDCTKSILPKQRHEVALLQGHSCKSPTKITL